MAAFGYTGSFKTLIDGLIAGAKNRANHTGAQSVSTITGLATVATSGAYGDLSGQPVIPSTSAGISDFQEAAQDAAGALFRAGTNVTFTYDDAANTLTINAVGGGSGSTDPEIVRDVIGGALVGGANLQITVNDAADSITIGVTGLATVATSGSYTDLTNKPSIPAVSGTNTGDQNLSLSGQSLTLSGGGGTVTLPTTGGGSAPTESDRTALARFHALAMYRNTKPVYVVCCGDSWTFGTGSSGGANNWISRLHTRLAAYFTLDSGVTQGAVAYINNPGAGGMGIRIVGNGHSGATSATYLPAQEVIDMLKMQPAMVIHAIGLNDQAQSFTKSAYKANVLAAVNAIRQQSTAPVVQLLVRNPELKRSAMAYPWSDYGDALREIAATDPNTLVYVDLTPSFEQAQIRNGDPLAIMQPDGGHPNDAGHAFIAELLFAALRPLLTLGLSAVGTPPADLPANYATAVPTISGTATVGNALSVGTGTWTATPDSYTYQWRRAGVDIAGATAPTYPLVSADAGTSVSAAVTSVKTGYASRTAVAVGVAIAASGSSSFTTLGTPTISGTPNVGQTLTANTGTWSPTPDSYTYQWNRAGAAISGATSATYLLVSADTNQTITVTVTAIKSGYTSASVTSASVSASAAGGSTFTSAGTPTISGTPTVGQTLTAVPGTWSPAADSYLYQWNRAGAAISGATAATYTLVTADIGTVTVTVTGVKSGYTNLAATSAGVTVAASAGGGTLFADTFTGTDGDTWNASLWTKKAGNGTLSIASNQGRLATPATANDYVLAFATGMTATFDQELYAEFTTPATGFITFGISTQLFSYTAPNNGYFMQMQVGSGYQAKRSLNGTASQIDYQASPTILANTAYRIRFKRVGSVIYYRTWLASDSAEPSTWKMTYTDATPTTIAGQVWVLLTNPNTATALSATVDNISVITPS